jgi:PhnB protein
MPSLSPYLTMNGACTAAFRFYEKALDGKILEMHSFANSPMAGSVPDQDKDKVMHACIEINGQYLMGTDGMPGQCEQKMQGVSLALVYETAEQARQAFEALSPGATITMPLAETFWADAFGMLVDQFGVSWSINGGDKSPAPQG